MNQVAVVIPVYNEEACISKVIKSWWRTLNELNIKFLLIILNDGSTDNTLGVLEDFRNLVNIEIINKINSGHGPTVLMGYRMAEKLAEWVFQCDSDDEMSPIYFRYLWKERERYDLLLGKRVNRSQNFLRKTISVFSNVIIDFLFGKGITDVNTPYRLIRSDILRQIVYDIPEDTFAPNVLISGLFVKYGFKTFEYPVPHSQRKTGKVSIMGYKLFKSAAEAFFQTLAIRKKWLSNKLINFE